MRRDRLIDVAVGAGCAGWTLVVMWGQPWAAALVGVAALAGCCWRWPPLMLTATLVSTTLVPWWTHVPASSPWNMMPIVAAASFGLFARLPLAVIGDLLIAASIVLAAPEGMGVLDLGFIAVILTSVTCVAHAVGRAVRSARQEGGQAAYLESVDVDELAERAVAAERVRLALDIQSVVQRAVTSMRAAGIAAAEAWEADPRPSLATIQEGGRQAVGELRRLLGLLRETPGPPVPAADLPAREPPMPTRRWRRVAVDVGLGVGMAVLSLAELPLYARDPPPATTGSLVLTAVAAGQLGLRRAAPALGAALCGLAFLAGALTGEHARSGLACVVTIVVLAWCAAGRRTLAGGAGVGVLMLGCVVATVRADPGGVALVSVVVAIPAVGGFVTAGRRAEAGSARRSVDRLNAAHELASAEAVRAERLAVARELHDLVSHGVTVMSVQAGAALALLDREPDAARHALEIIDDTAVRTLAELENLLSAIKTGAFGPCEVCQDAGPGEGDLAALAERMRAGGLRVELTVTGESDVGIGSTAFRIVQEALTNALRHAPGTRVRVKVATTTDGTTIDVLDDGPGLADGGGPGYGLVGITERVRRVGGRVTAGPRPHGPGFRVQALLPPESSLRR